MENNITAASATEGLMHFIIGKLWVRSNDGTKPGSIRISRTLPGNITLLPGTTLFLHENKKREGKEHDADFNVSILLPTETAKKMIDKEKVIAAKFKAEAAALASEPM